MRDNFNVHEWNIQKIREENKGRDTAREFISKMRDVMRSLSDDELDTFRKDIAQAFDLNVNEGLSEDKADATRWFSNLKYFYQKAFRELKGEDRETYKQLAKDFFSKLEIDDKVRPVGLDEDWNGGIDKVTLMYTNYGDLYKVKIDGKTVDTKDVEDLVGMEIPTDGYYHSEEVIAVVDALKRKGINADSTEIDVD